MNFVRSLLYLVTFFLLFISYTAFSGGEPPLIIPLTATTSPPTQTVNVGQSIAPITITASGGTGPYTYSISSGALPAGVTLSSNTISGTPTTVGNYSFTITVTDASDGATSTVTATITVNPPLTITTNPSQAIRVVGTAFSTNIAASGGTSPYTYSISNGSLPPGVSLNPNTGVIAGVPTAAGTYIYAIRVTDTVNATRTVTTRIPVVNPPLTAAITNSSQTADVGQSITPITITASGGTGIYTYSISSGSLPAGVTLSSNTITGTPTTVGNYNFIVTVRDTANTTRTLTAAITVNPPLTAAITNSSQTVDVGQSITPITITASGGTSPYIYSISSGALPAGVSLNTSTGLITGTPTISGNYNFTVSVTDNIGATVPNSFSLNVNSTITITPGSLPNLTVGEAISMRFSASGGNAPYIFSVVSGSLPEGLSLSSDGTLSGIAQNTNDYDFAVAVEDGNGDQVSQSYVWQASFNNPSAEHVTKSQINSQSLAIQQSIQTVIGNIGNHLNDLHIGPDHKATSNELRFNLIQPKAQSRRMEQNMVHNKSKRVNMTKPSSVKVEDLSNLKLDIADLWIKGDINYGSIKYDDRKSKLFSSGVSIGIDNHIRNNLIIGAAAGFGWDEQKLDDNLSKTNSIIPSFSLYGSFKATDKLFIDALMGYAKAKLKNTRLNSIGTLLQGERKAESYFGSLTATYSLSSSIFRFDPFIKGDLSTSKYHSYTENGNNTLALSYKPMNISVSYITGGVMGSIDIKRTKEGGLSIFSKLQYSRSANSNEMQNIFYIAAPNTVYSSQVAGYSVSLDLGLNYTNKKTFWELLIGCTRGTSSYINKRVTAIFQYAF
jgi:hypothetical protein